MRALILVCFWWALMNCAFAGVKKMDGLYFQAGCAIFDKSGSLVQKVIGDLCIFLDDGSYVSGSQSSLSYFGHEGDLKWSLKVPTHHQINLSEDKKRILVLSSSFKESGEKCYREDRFLSVSLSGQILAESTIGNLLSADQFLDYPIRKDVIAFPGCDKERSHFNSIAEIPSVPMRKDAPWLKKGNYIVNSIEMGILILSADLTKVLHRFKYPRSRNHQIHDAKILSSGKLLLFNNLVFDVDTKIPYSSVDLVDPVSFKPSLIIGRKDSFHFYSPVRSGAHIFGDLLIFSLEWMGVYVVDMSTKKVIFGTLNVNIGPFVLHSHQEVRLLRLLDFLQNYKGPKMRSI